MTLNTNLGLLNIFILLKNVTYVVFPLHGRIGLRHGITKMVRSAAKRVTGGHQVETSRPVVSRGRLAVGRAR